MFRSSSVIDTLGLVSGDSHINEPRNLWRDNLPPTLRSQAMRGIKPGEPGNWELILEGERLGEKAEAEAERVKMADPEHRYTVMREEGVVGECIYPTTGLYVWLLTDPEVMGGVLSRLQRVDRRWAGPLASLQVCGARPDRRTSTMRSRRSRSSPTPAWGRS